MKTPIKIALLSILGFAVGWHLGNVNRSKGTRPLVQKTIERKVDTAVVRYYDERYNGRKTANGEVFDAGDLTFASASFPFNTRLRVSYNGNSVVVRCNDRGPNKIELTKGAFNELAIPAIGKITATYEVLN